LADILLFLGSGASVPFGLPTMKKLVELFQSYLLSRSFSYEEYLLMKRIYSDIKHIISDTYEYVDLESVFTVIEPQKLRLNTRYSRNTRPELQ
jgi:hypothetical protein